jgi:hypothetical protein
VGRTLDGLPMFVVVMVGADVRGRLGGRGEDGRKGEGAERDPQDEGYSHGNLLLMLTNGQYRALFRPWTLALARPTTPGSGAVGNLIRIGSGCR